MYCNKINVELKAYESKNISLIFGEDIKDNIPKLVKKYKNIENCKAALEDTKEYWKIL